MQKTKLVLAILMLIALSGCTDTATAKRTLEASGFKNVQITGWEPFACSKDDSISTGFIATAPNGSTVKGAVCSGLVFKNSTIRLQ